MPLGNAATDSNAGSREELNPSAASPPPPGAVTIADLEDRDDDDIEYEPPSGNSIASASTDTSDEEADAWLDDDEDEEDEFLDAQDNLGDVEIEFSVGDGESTPTGAADDINPGQTAQINQLGREAIRMTPTQLLAVLQSNAPFRRFFTQSMARAQSTNQGSNDDHDDLTDNTEVEGWRYGASRRRRRHSSKTIESKFPAVPSMQGRELMKSGIYGSRDDLSDLRRRRKDTLSARLMWRRLGVKPRGSLQRENRLIRQNMVPLTSIADKTIHYDFPAYSGQFSDDGNFFFSCTQDFKVRMYDTSNPYEWKYYKTVDYPFGQWTITDATLSPDNRWLAYSSIRHLVYLAPTDPCDTSDPTLLNFADFATSSAAGGRRTTSARDRSWFGIWSLRFSGDGREIVAGTSEHSVIVYDLETQQSILRLANHQEHVNAVCFGDTSSPHILYSGSDDQTIRVWDRRSMADGREAGVFVGHTEGLTYVDSKGDGRYVLSNGKDQTMKLWDLRKMMSPSKFERLDLSAYSTRFDYRGGQYDFAEYEPNPEDCSVVTFRGHSVLRTLIRCHFSPPGSTNSAYVYSGSADGSVWIWNLDGTVRGKVDVGAATTGTRPRHPDMSTYRFMSDRHDNKWRTCVRDASWHPYAPVLAATSWNGWDMCNGTVSLHSWNDGIDDDEGDPPLGTNYNARLEPVEEFNEHARKSRGQAGSLRSRAVRPTRYGREGGGGGGGGGGEVSDDTDGYDGW